MKEIIKAVINVFIEMPRGMLVTLKHLFKKPVTLDYPKKKKPMAPRYRGRHYLERYDDGTERHSASVGGIKNGDRVIVTGELRSSSGTVPSTTFWASNVEKTVERGAAQGDERINLANVNTIEIMILESFPVQINVAARGEHPDSCTKVDEITTVREGNTFVVTINAFRPADAMCAQVITPYEEVVALDVFELKAGVYTVDVNGIRDTFELQMDN